MKLTNEQIELINAASDVYSHIKDILQFVEKEDQDSEEMEASCAHAVANALAGDKMTKKLKRLKKILEKVSEETPVQKAARKGFNS
jgi:hypothetical protein